VTEGHHIVDPGTGKRTEKQSDINLALSLFQDAHANAYDCAYILSGDSDQAATARFLKDHFPNKFLIGVAPPNIDVPHLVKQIADDHFVLTIDQVERAVFDGPVLGRSGKPIPRPPSYDPPLAWRHPNHRQKK